MFYIYILYSESADMFYVGHTDDFKKRLKQHNEKLDFNTFTSKNRPWKPVALFECGAERRTAIKIEDFIKKQHSRSLIIKLIDPTFKPAEKLAQLVRVSHLQD